MPTEEIYQIDPLTGETKLVETIIIPGAPDLISGEATLVNGAAIVNTMHAGRNVILSRNQAISSGFGHLYVDLDFTIPGQSFRIRSSSTSDNGTVFWQIVE